VRGLGVLTAAVLLGALMNPPSASAAGSPPAKPEQAVLVHFDYGSRDWAPFFKFEERLEHAVTASGTGDYDGNELAVDGSDGTLYMYGPDADKLFAVVRPLLESTPLLKHVVVTLRYGNVNDPHARELKVHVGS
jgi:hypothetical protein